jgi:hypothetical protein
MTKRPEVVELALNGSLKAVLSLTGMPDLSLGACVGMDTDLFFSGRNADVQAAKAVCAECPVIRLCGSWAAQNMSYGIFGGLTPRERAKEYGKPARRPESDVEKELRFLLNGTLNEIAAQYEADQRTVLRWRNILKSYGLAA